MLIKHFCCGTETMVNSRSADQDDASDIHLRCRGHDFTRRVVRSRDPAQSPHSLH